MRTGIIAFFAMEREVLKFLYLLMPFIWLSNLLLALFFSK